MSIAWYPLEPDEPPRPPPIAKPVSSAPVPVVKTFMEGESSECNYVVLVFVFGVLFLAFTDAMRR
jgi:hypothetical protein